MSNTDNQQQTDQHNYDDDQHNNGAAEVIAKGDVPANGNGQTIEHEPADTRSAVQQARELIPVGPTGAQPANFAQQVDYAKTMTLAKAAIPRHLQNNVGDCLAVIDIASRAGMSPYMLAGKTYVQNDRLCFESQAYHALAQASGLMNGDFIVEWEGDGDDMRCIITGYLKGDPVPKTLKSELLKDLHPGYTLKKFDGNTSSKSRPMTYAEGVALKEAGIEPGAKLFCLGSPLWERKPQVQMFYDTSRDWVRIYAPRATLGIYTPDEIVQYQDEIDEANNARAQTHGDQLRTRLKDTTRDEGHREGHADSELSKLGAGPKTVQPADDTQASPRKGAKPAGAGKAGAKGKAAPAAAKGNEVAKDGGKGNAAKATEPEPPRATTLERGKPTSASHAKRVADRAAERSEATTPKPPKEPSTADEYAVWARYWIGKANYDEAQARWDGEKDLRAKCGVPIKMRKELYALIEAKSS